MSESWMQITLVLVLIAVNALFAGSEMALVVLREGQIERLKRKGGRGRILADLAADPNQYLATIQLGITLAGFLASATAAVSLARPLLEPLNFLGSLARPASIFLVTIVLTFLTLVFGEIAPKRVALQRAESWALASARPIAFISSVSRPPVWLLSKATDLVVRLFGGDPSQQREVMTGEELRDLIASRPGVTSVQRDILSGALEISERSIGDVMVDRRRVLTLSADMEIEEAIQLLQTHGRSRAPVEGENIDDIIGVVHLRDLIGKTGPVRGCARDVLALPGSTKVTRALALMQSRRQHLAVVVDEFGGTDGIVTIEDLLEEIVGEIYDEFDRNILEAERHPDGTIVLPGNYPVHDLEELGIDLPSGAYSTIAGFVLERLGRLPDPGEVLEVRSVHLEVLEVRDNAIHKVVVRPSPPDQRR